MRKLTVFVITFCCLIFSGSVVAAKLKISEKTKFYTIKGKSATEFALSMSKNGPYSAQHRQRAWATAGRDLKYQLIRQKGKKSCRVRDAKVRLKIVYTMPRLRQARVSSRERKRWKRMYALLDRHERVHGRYYKQFAKRVHRALKRMSPVRSCRALDRKAKKLVAKLSEADRLKNNRFDKRDRRSYRRMERLYTGG